MNSNGIKLGVLLISVLISMPIQALTIVRMDVQLGEKEGVDTTKQVDIELFEESAPANVSNFLGYVNRGDYDESFFHRKARYSDGVTPFVIQGGGFRYLPDFDTSARFVNFLSSTCLLDFADEVTGELGLRPINELYYVDADMDDKPDFVNPLIDPSVATVDPCENLTFSNAIFHPTYVNWLKRNNNGLSVIEVPDTDLATDGIQAGVPGEPGLSNTRGTLAMALTTGPDTASNQWFVNMTDNLQLDTQNGGFTVFGRVIGNGMDVFDIIDGYPVNAVNESIHPAFANLPITDDYEVFTLIRNRHLIKVKSAREVLNIDLTEHDFGYVDAYTAEAVVITITNRQAAPITIDKIGDTNTLVPPFSSSTDCTAVAINPGGVCQITITFSPQVAGLFHGAFDISFIDPDIPNINVSVDGVGVTQPPRFVADTTIDLGDIQVNTVSTAILEITNHGTQDLVIAGFDADDSDVSLSSDCATLAFDTVCELSVTVTTGVLGDFTSSVTMTSNDPASPHVISIVARVNESISPTLVVDSEVDFGDAKIDGGMNTGTVTLENTGLSDIVFDEVVCCGEGVLDYEIAFTSCASTLTPGASCSININFTPMSSGRVEGVLAISTNDTLNPVIEVLLTGTGGSDNDNIPDQVEDAASNLGDGNNDGFQDSQQENVVSFARPNGAYITFSVPQGYEIQDTRALTDSELSTLPSGLVTNGAALSASISGQALQLADLGIIDVGFTIPITERPVAFYNFGPTADDPVPHWYEFTYNGETGARILEDVFVTAPTPDGGEIKRHLVVVSYKDGGRGDNDLDINGVIEVESAVIIASDVASNGALHPLWALLCLLTFRAFRNNTENEKR